MAGWAGGRTAAENARLSPLHSDGAAVAVIITYLVVFDLRRVRDRQAESRYVGRNRGELVFIGEFDQWTDLICF